MSGDSPTNGGGATGIIPMWASDLDVLIAEIGRQTTEVSELVQGVPAESRAWRSGPEKWSIMGHVAHLCLVNAPYVAAIDACIAQARASGKTGEGPYRHPWLGKWFTRQMEPPPKRRFRTGKKMRPDPRVDAESTLEDFETLQRDLVRLMTDARGVDLGKARFSSPFARVLRLSVGTGFSAIAGHNRRHIWLIRELMDEEGFPVAPPEADGVNRGLMQG